MIDVLFAVLKIIAIIAAILLLIGILLIIGLSSFFKPKNISDSVAEIKQFLGVDFGEGYTVINHLSRDNHPDRPLDVELTLTEDTLNKIKIQLEDIQPKSTEIVNANATACEITSVEKNESGFNKSTNRSHMNSDGSKYMYYSCRLTINYQNHILKYSNSCY